MRNILKYTLLACLILTLGCIGKESANAQSASMGKEMLLADPFVLEDNGIFYIYGTSSRDGILVYKSTDLKSWQGPCGATEGHALHKDDSWGREMFWAPEVYKVGNKFVMTYSTQEHITYAEADSPLGPFVYSDKKPYLEEKGIDSHIFVDEDGKTYMYWVRFDNGNVIFSAEMAADMKSVDMSTLSRIIDVQEGTWEKTSAEPVANVAEGPFVVKKDGLYYLTYSCNHYQSRDYAVGYAVAKSPMGPWVRYQGNPILHNHGGYSGTGHHALLKTAEGNMYIIYHAHYSHEQIGPRRTLISAIEFKKDKNGVDILVVSDEVIVPLLVN